LSVVRRPLLMSRSILLIARQVASQIRARLVFGQ
jgi:hypothetical protein